MWVFTVQLTREKATGLQNVCSELLENSSPSIREVASALYYRRLEKDKSQALARTNGNFDGLMSLSHKLNPYYNGGLNMWEMHTM